MKTSVKQPTYQKSHERTKVVQCVLWLTMVIWVHNLYITSLMCHVDEILVMLCKKTHFQFWYLINNVFYPNRLLAHCYWDIMTRFNLVMNVQWHNGHSIWNNTFIILFSSSYHYYLHPFYYLHLFCVLMMEDHTNYYYYIHKFVAKCLLCNVQNRFMFDSTLAIWYMFKIVYLSTRLSFVTMHSPIDIQDLLLYNNVMKVSYDDAFATARWHAMSNTTIG